MSADRFHCHVCDRDLPRGAFSPSVLHYRTPSCRDCRRPTEPHPETPTETALRRSREVAAWALSAATWRTP